MVKDDEKVTQKAVSTLGICIYAIYDSQLKQFEPPFSCHESNLDAYMTMLVNDPQSRYFKHEDAFILNKIADFSQATGMIKQCSVVERIKFLDAYIDKNKRQLQTIVQTLNFLPTGYFKMPQEQKESIQKEIDDSITRYVENYVVPDMDVNNISDSFYKGVKVRIDFLKSYIDDEHTECPDQVKDYIIDLLDNLLVNKNKDK